MFPEGKDSLLTTTHRVRQRISVPSSEMIPQRKDNFEKPLNRRRGHIQRLNSAPLLHTPSELPPIENGVKTSKPHRPLTPLVVCSGPRASSASSKSLPKNYRINLDLTPLVEVGACNGLVFERKRQTSLGSDTEFSSNSPKIRSLSSSPKTRLYPGNMEPPRSTFSNESLEDTEPEKSLLEENGKDKMILKWLQTIERNDNLNGEQLLPAIKEGRLT